MPNEPDLPVPPLPYRLDGGQQIDWSLRFVDPLRDDLREKGYRGAVPIWGIVYLGNGKRIKSRDPMYVLVPD